MLCLGILGGLWLGGYWYARNAVEYHNPFAPLTIRADGRVLFTGFATPEGFGHTTLLRMFDPSDYVDWLTLNQEVGEHLGAAFYAMLWVFLGGLAVALDSQESSPPRSAPRCVCVTGAYRISLRQHAV